MPWLRSRRRFIPPAAAPVPTSEVLRVAALRSSWRRDHWVSRRRLWFRWSLWGLQRYAVQISGGVVTLFALGYLLLPLGRTPPEDLSAGVATAKPDPVPVVSIDTRSTPPAPPEAQPLATGASAAPPPLRLERDWNGAAQAAAAPPSASEATQQDFHSIPKLKPENWLHSKEP